MCKNPIHSHTCLPQALHIYFSSLLIIFPSTRQTSAQSLSIDDHVVNKYGKKLTTLLVQCKKRDSFANQLLCKANPVSICDPHQGKERKKNEEQHKFGFGSGFLQLGFRSIFLFVFAKLNDLSLAFCRPGAASARAATLLSDSWHGCPRASPMPVDPELRPRDPRGDGSTFAKWQLCVVDMFWQT